MRLTRRVYDEPAHPYRSPFARDAARILHARAFRRLAGKTQVFTRLPGDPTSDHFRSRLTHTLEVAQISRTLAARAGPECGAGRSAGPGPRHRPSSLWPCRRKSPRPRPARHGLSFDHNLHALRIVTWFEERYAGLSRPQPDSGRARRHREALARLLRQPHTPSWPSIFLDQFPPLEAQLIDLTDEIAYLTADLDDGLDSGILDAARSA